MFVIVTIKRKNKWYYITTKGGSGKMKQHGHKLVILLIGSMMLSGCGEKIEEIAPSPTSTQHVEQMDESQVEETEQHVIEVSKEEDIDKHSEEPIEEEKSETAKAKFDKDDSVIEGLKLGMTKEEVKTSFGEPESIEEVDQDTFIYGKYIVYKYTGMTLMFYDVEEKDELLLGSVYIDGNFVRLTNGLRVGFTAEEVKKAYADDGEHRPTSENEPWGYFLYGDYLYTSEKDYALPKKYEQVAFYTVPSNEMGDYYISYDCITPMGNSFEDVGLVFYIDANDTITGIRWERNRRY